MADTEVRDSPDRDGEQAGLIARQSEEYYYLLWVLRVSCKTHLEPRA